MPRGHLALGRRGEALDHYQRFLEQWIRADEGLEPLTRARDAARRLRADEARGTGG